MSTPTDIKDPVTESGEVEQIPVPVRDKKEPENHEHEFHVACGGGCPMTPPGN